MRQDMEEAARMVKYRFNVSGLVDHLGNLVELVAGDPVEAHRTGVKKAKELYYFLVGEKADVVFACSNPLDVDCFQSIKGLLPSTGFVRKGGVIFWVSACPEGIGTHQLTQLDADYNANMKKAQQEICRRHKVLFYSDALDSGEIRRYLADEIQFFNNPDRAAEALALAAGPEAVAKILYAAPFTVGV